MDDPGRINGIRRLIQVTENTAADDQSCHHEEQKPDIHHAHQHAYVVHREQGGADYVSRRTRRVFLQGNEAVAAEEEFLQKGVHEGDIQSHEDEILGGDAHALG